MSAAPTAPTATANGTGTGTGTGAGASASASHERLRPLEWLRPAGSAWVGGVIGVVLVLALWSIISTTVLTTADGVPTPWAVVRQMVDDGWSFYWPLIQQTGAEALRGYVGANALALACGVLVLLVPWSEPLITQIGVASYCLPILAVGPILSLVFSGNAPMAAMAGLFVFFTTLVGVLLGLRSADPTALDLVRAYGGGRWQRMRRVQIVAALPSLAAALKVAGPSAVLGAIIGEYLGGVSSGLGVAMTASETQLNVARTWAIALVAGALGGVAYLVVGLVARFALPWARGSSIEGST